MEVDRSTVNSCIMAVFKCIFRNCFDHENERNNTFVPNSSSSHPMIAPTMPSSNHMGRTISSSSLSRDEEPDNSNSTNSPLTTATISEQSSSLFSRLRNFGIHQPKETISRFLPLRALSSTFSTDSENITDQQHLIRRTNKVAPDKSFLKEANTYEYDVNKEVPTIYQNEFILPGSEIQKSMAIAMKANVEDHGDECVICMDVFSPENPRMPTLCGCGENKTYFHLPCLYQWIEENRNCPSCRKLLRWEEF